MLSFRWRNGPDAFPRGTLRPFSCLRSALERSISTDIGCMHALRHRLRFLYPMHDTSMKAHGFALPGFAATPAAHPMPCRTAE